MFPVLNTKSWSEEIPQWVKRLALYAQQPELEPELELGSVWRLESES